MMKRCIVCECWRSKDDFSKDSSRKDGLHPYCKKCRSTDNKRYMKENPLAKERRTNRSKQWRKENPERSAELIKKWKASNKERKQLLDRKSQLWSHYKLTIETYLNILNSQDGLCAICKLKKRLYVDHDHSCCSGNITCGECIRGLICQKCNMFMHYVDEYDLFEEALLYAKKRMPNPDSRDSDA